MAETLFRIRQLLVWAPFCVVSGSYDSTSKISCSTMYIREITVALALHQFHDSYYCVWIYAVNSLGKVNPFIKQFQTP